MNLKHLKIFEAVAAAGSIRAAARGCELTQPAMTYAIRELEHSVGAQLLVRSAKGVVLTPIGEALLRRARLLADEVRRTEEEIAQLRDGAGGSLRVAFSSFAVERLLPNALLDFRARWPGVALELQELSGTDVNGLWKRSEFDFAILGELEPVADDGLQREMLLDFPLAVVAKAGHPLARVRTMGKLHEAMWVVPSYGAELLRRCFAQLGEAPPRDIVVCHSWQLGMTLVKRAGALTLASSSLFSRAAASRGLVALRLADRLPNVQVSLLMRDRAALTPAAQAFAQALQAVARTVQAGV
ncbi:LysR family transcriptional regulator [Variovorax sp. RCC_210]|uniref:LysR family transcriptional regulator n=1 Tax=Variovorax sp. RCC_210 TaxID=3239217 RepID=UPI00352376D0